MGSRNLALTAYNQPGAKATASSSSSQSGSYFLPWQEELGQKLGNTYANALDSFVNKFNSQPGGDGASAGALPGGGDFASYFNSVAGPTGSGQFTNIPQNPVWTPQMLNQATNDLFSDASARSANQAREIQQGLRPGFGANSAVQAELLNANQGRNDAIAAREANSLFQRAGVENAQHGLNTAIAQSNVENLRSAHQRQLAQLASGVRGQDVQRDVALQGIAADERNALLRAFGGFGGGGGFLQPLQFSQSESSTNFDPLRAFIAELGASAQVAAAAAPYNGISR